VQFNKIFWRKVTKFVTVSTNSVIHRKNLGLWSEIWHHPFPINIKLFLVVLLDEADVFLEERTMTDLDRNALVSGKQHMFVESSKS
jgi:hypothetical protein